MRFGALAIAVAAGTAGALLGYYVRGERSGVTAPTGGRTVMVTKTVVRTIERPDPRAGKRVFLTVCSRCHTFAPGDLTGNRVSLTDLQPSYRATVEQVTSGGIAMPSFEGKLSKREIRDVAAFVKAETARRRVTRHSARLRSAEPPAPLTSRNKPGRLGLCRFGAGRSEEAGPPAARAPGLPAGWPC
jgi:cytochrome c6